MCLRYLLAAIILCISVFSSGRVASAQDLPLLPQPRQLQRGQGALPLAQVAIIFQGTPTDEDLLAVDALGTILSAAGGRIVDSPAAGGVVTAIRFQRTATTSSWEWDDAPGPDSSESYSIDINDEGALLKAPTARGLFYAVQTFRQLLSQENGSLTAPFVTIQDWPQLRLRGFMLDLSHGPFPKFEELKRQIDFLARWKANQFYLYSETNIELDGFPLLSQRARLTKAQVRALIAYARDRFIDVVPCVELYGHLHDLARIEHYSALGETPHGGEVNPLDPKAQALIENWVGQFAELFPSPWLHVGFDETYELGKMPGRKLTPERRGEVYLGFFERVASMVTAKGKRVMVWSDIILQHPEVIPKLPAGAIAVPWRYADETSYDHFVEPLSKADVPLLVGTAVWSYYDAAPDFDHTMRNVNGFLQSARKYNALGLVHTEWTDGGPVLFRTADPAVAFGPVAAWHADQTAPELFYQRYARLHNPKHHATLSDLLSTIALSQGTLERALGTRVMQELWQDPLDRKRLDRATRNASDLREARLQAEKAQVLALSILSDEDDPLVDFLLFSARLLDYIALRQIYALEIDGFRTNLATEPTRANYRLLFGIQTSDHTHSRLFDLMDEAGELKQELRKLWLRDYTPFRLETSMGRWQAEFERWRSLQEKLALTKRDYKDGDAPPE